MGRSLTQVRVFGSLSLWPFGQAGKTVQFTVGFYDPFDPRAPPQEFVIDDLAVRSYCSWLVVRQIAVVCGRTVAIR